jgi:predicted PurR-regulated permease PerM
MAEIKLSARTKFIIVLVLAAIAVFIIYKTGHIIVPFIWALVTAYIFNPVITYFSRRTKTNRVWWVLLLYIILGFIMAWVFLRVVPLVVNQLVQLEREIPSLVRSGESIFGASGTIDILGFNISTADINAQVGKWAADAANFLSRGALGLIVSAVEIVISLFVYTFASFYLLLDGARIIDIFRQQIPVRYQPEINAVLIRINRVLSAFIRGQILLVLIMSTATYTILSILQVKYALLLALATGLLELIPFVGPYTAGGLAVSVAFLQGSAPFGWSPFFLAAMIALAYFILRQLEDNLVIPNVIGSLVELHPLVVIFVVLAGASFGGITGLFLAVPFTAVARVVIGFLYPKLVEREPPKPVFLAPNDTLQIAIDKVSGAGVPNVLLMIPKDDEVVSTRESLQRLRDSARRAKVNLSVSCPNDHVCYRAEKMGLRAMYDFQEPSAETKSAPVPLSED